MPAAVDDFLKTALRSGLLTREQLQDALREVPEGRRDDPEALAAHLIKTGKLSRFQAHKLLKGTAFGLVLGPFQVLAPIGKGGMGTVYLARDARNGQLLALKILPPKRARAEERLLARFRREMEISRRVAHEHIAWTYDVGVEQGVYYIAMEYIPGRSLYRLVGDEGPLTVRRAARLFSEICTGLEHAHAQGVIHRDLKPSNIMVTPNDHAKLLDLGLALVEGEVGAEREVVGGAGYVVGSMDWIAPEQTEDAARVDARSDLYGLGCTLYFALSGRPPFKGGTSREKIYRHRNEGAARLEVLNSRVPPTFADLVHRLMAKSPAERFDSAAAVRQALAPWVSDEPALPLDRQGDPEFFRAVAAVQQGEVPPELIEAGEAGEGPPAASGVGREYVWLGVGLVGFWVVLVAVLGLVLLLR
jgi:eukaryotic-like serine/threonine-protein kinase